MRVRDAGVDEHGVECSRIQRGAIARPGRASIGGHFQLLQPDLLGVCRFPQARARTGARGPDGNRRVTNSRSNGGTVSWPKRSFSSNGESRRNCYRDEKRTGQREVCSEAIHVDTLTVP